jgi:HPt (histidine-containing phosphotransfer) domain-containing protein
MNAKMRWISGVGGDLLLRVEAPQSADGISVRVCVMIDWKRVEELREEIGADGFAEVTAMFLDEAEGAVKALLRGIPAEEVEGQLHFLKGSALNLGLSELAAICQDGERLAAAGEGMLVDVSLVASVWRASRAGLLGGLSTDQAGAA